MVDFNAKETSSPKNSHIGGKVTILSNSSKKNKELHSPNKPSIKTPKKVTLRSKSSSPKENISAEKKHINVSSDNNKHSTSSNETSPRAIQMKAFFSNFLEKTKKYSLLAVEKMKAFYLYLKPKCIDFFNVMYPQVKSFLIWLWDMTKLFLSKSWDLLCVGAKKIYKMIQKGIDNLKSR